MEEDKKTAFQPTDYDKNISSLIPFLNDIYFQIIDLIHTLHKENISWLDIGCGTGAFMHLACAECKVSRVVLCDISPEMLRAAEQKISIYPVEKTFLLQASQQINAEDQFDVITSIQVHHYLQKEQREAALRNCFRALKEGGIYITFENLAPYSSIGKEIGLKRWGNFQKKNGRSKGEIQKHLDRYGKAYFPITAADHLQALHTCGFSSAEIFWISYLQGGFYAIK